MKCFGLLLLILVFPVFAFCQNGTYINPVGNFIPDGDTADPYVLKYNGKYYLYATSWQSYWYGFKVWESDDLVNWVPRGDCFRNDLSGNDWGTRDFWAPEVIHHNEQFYLVYSARTAEGKLQIALANSSSPLGPFKNLSAPLLGDELWAIDGHFFFDTDGSIYLYYSIEINYNIVNGHNTAEIFVQRMSDELIPVGDPILVATPEQEWELKTGDWRWNEAPTVLKDKGTYYLMYSGNVFSSPDYGIGFATALSPTGPFTKYAENPILSAEPGLGISGPGHNSVTRSPDDTEMFVVYHAHIDPENTRLGRTIYIDRMRITYTGLIIDGPTNNPQPMPSNIQSKLEPTIGNTPRDFKINTIYPNPFNGWAIIDFNVAYSSQITMKIYNINGELVRSIKQDGMNKGHYRVRWDGTDINGQSAPSGVYFCTLSANGQLRDSQRLIFIK